MAKDRKHVEELGKVLEERVGTRPRLEVRAGGEASGVRTQETGEPPPEGLPASPDPEPAAPEPVREPPAREEDGGFDEPVARADAPGARFGAPEAAEGTIQSETEVFEIMRGFGQFGQGKGN